MTQPLSFASVTIKAFIASDNRILLVHDREKPDRWEMPGGRITRGEQPLDTLQREVQEEVGAEIFSLQLFDAFVFRPDPDPKGDPNALYLSLVYLVDIGDQEIKPGGEIGAARWFGFGDLEQLQIEANSRDFLQHVRVEHD